MAIRSYKVIPFFRGLERGWTETYYYETDVAGADDRTAVTSAALALGEKRMSMLSTNFKMTGIRISDITEGVPYNGRPTYLKGTLLTGIQPIGPAGPPSESSVYRMESADKTAFRLLQLRGIPATWYSAPGTPQEDCPQADAFKTADAEWINLLTANATNNSPWKIRRYDPGLDVNLGVPITSIEGSGNPLFPGKVTCHFPPGAFVDIEPYENVRLSIPRGNDCILAGMSGTYWTMHVDKVLGDIVLNMSNGCIGERVIPLAPTGFIYPTGKSFASIRRCVFSSYSERNTGRPFTRFRGRRRSRKCC